MKNRKHLTTALKLVLGAVVVWLIAKQLTLDDQIVLRDANGASQPPLSGRHLKINGEVVLQGPNGPQRAPIERCLVRRDGAQFTVEVRSDGGRPAEKWVGQAVDFVGTARIDRADGSPLELPLSNVAVRYDGKPPELVQPNAKFGLASIFRRIDDQPLFGLGAMVCMAIAYATGVLRWMWLLRAQGLEVTFGRALRLTFIGVFFNNVMPGLTGGDIVKAVMIARDHPEQRPAAVGTVIVDRVLGIVVLAMMSAVVLVFNLTRFREASIAVFGFLGCATAGLLLFFSRRIRRAIGLDTLVKRMPGAGVARKLDAAFFMYRSQLPVVAKATLVSIVSHLGNIGAIYLFGLAIGLDQRAGIVGNSLVAYFATVPVAMIISSIPLLPGGWGIGEGAYAYFFGAVGIWNIDLSIALSVVQRTAMLVWSLIGGVFFFTHRRNVMDAVHVSEETETIEPPPHIAAR